MVESPQRSVVPERTPPIITWDAIAGAPSLDGLHNQDDEQERRKLAS